MKKKIFMREAFNVSMLLPITALFVFCVLTPFINSLWIMLTNWDGLSATYKFVGLKNFQYLFKSKDAITPVVNTLYFTLFNTFLVNVVGFLLAYLVNVGFKGSNICKAVFFMPVAVSMVLAGYTWTYVFAYVFPVLGLPSMLGMIETAKNGLIIVNTWRDAGFAMVIYYAGMQGVPQSIIESAEIDGANAWRKLTRITMPMMISSFTINFTMFFGWSMKTFELPMTTTSGGPGRATETFAIYVYKYAFVGNMVGFAQAAALLLMLIICTMSAVITITLRKRELEL